MDKALPAAPLNPLHSMLRSLVPLMSASFFVQASNAAITTMIGIVVAQKGGEQFDVALVAACYSLGFLAGCFLAPAQLARVGLIRGFIAATALLTISIVAIDMAYGVGLWAVLRLLMGASMASVLAVCDAWINDTTPNEHRGKVIAVYSIVLGLASLASQLVFLVFGVGEDFVLVFAITMNAAVVLVALTSASAPEVQKKAERSFHLLINVSVTANIGAFASGFMSASIVSIVPFYLADNGVPTKIIALGLATLYLGRLLFQWPAGKLSDQLDRRSVMAMLSFGIAVLIVLGAWMSEGEGRLAVGDAGVLKQIAAFALFMFLGGMVFPLYSVASSLAFDRAEGRPMIHISKTLLACHTVGSIVGPFSVMLISETLDHYALSVCIFVVSVVTGVTSLVKRVTVDAPEIQTTGIPPEPQTSLEMSEAAAELVEEQTSEKDTASPT